MHQCDYCIWYNKRKCGCPIQMRRRACERASKDKKLFEKGKQSQNDK